MTFKVIVGDMNGENLKLQRIETVELKPAERGAASSTGP
jgi:hypothetical protein